MNRDVSDEVEPLQGDNAMAAPDEMNSKAKDLIRAAFAAARGAKKADWHQMTVAVLKNRLLSLTNGEFDEAAYGATGVTHFASLFPDLLRVNSATVPPVVELIDLESIPEPEEPSEDVAVIVRVRPDLWRAVLDFSRGYDYLWDLDLKVARSVARAEPGLRLPTLNRDGFREWQAEFASQQAEGLQDALNEPTQVREWVEHGLGTRALPSRLQRPWNEFLKAQVIESLRAWFGTNQIDEPPDMITETRRTRPDVKDTDHVDALRRTALECVQVMNETELSELRLPIAAVLRSQRRRGHG